MKITKSDIEKNKYETTNNYKFDKLFIEYNFAYLKKFNEIEKYTINFKNNIHSFLTTSEKLNNKSKISYFNSPILIEVSNDNFNELEKIFSLATEELKYLKYDEIYIERAINEELIVRQMELFEGDLSIYEIYEENFLDLEKELDVLLKGFSKGHKYNIKYKDDLQYEIINHKNYKKNLMDDMKNLHEKVSGKKTRGDDTWKINEKMILVGQGFLIFVKKKEEVLSASFFFHNKKDCIYFSSCTPRNHFKKYFISHKTIWEAIKYTKSINIEKFHLGRSKTLKTRKTLTEKELNIERFKRSFGGKKNYLISSLIKDY